MNDGIHVIILHAVSFPASKQISAVNLLGIFVLVIRSSSNKLKVNDWPQNGKKLTFENTYNECSNLIRKLYESRIIESSTKNVVRL